jgi:hypothetical protein
MTMVSTFVLAFSRQLSFRDRLLWRIFEDWCRDEGLRPTENQDEELKQAALLAKLLDSLCSSNSRVQPFGSDGFLIYPPTSSPVHESVEWQSIRKPPLIYARLATSITSDSNATVSLQDFADLSSFLTPLVVDQPLRAGTPLQLLPYNTPAFYLSDFKPG